MAITNHERIGRGLELLRAGLAPYIEREVQEAVKAGKVAMDTIRRFVDDPLYAEKPIAQWDAAGLLKLMTETWNDVFRKRLGQAERTLANELRDWRNRWAHAQSPVPSKDAERALDSVVRLLTAVSAPQADDAEQMRQELRRLTIDEEVRAQTRKGTGSLLETAAAGGLPAWRDVITPHPDVAGGRYRQAEFAADLWQVHVGGGSDEYRDPVEFFRRTYVTQSLRRLLVGAIRRLGGGSDGDPVVDLQTNFGGGKTHSMLALYHLFSGADPATLAGLEPVLAEAGQAVPRGVKRVVLVGNKISPGNPSTKPDGTQVRTLWGELAWQLGGAAAYARVKVDDERATSPGDVLRELFDTYGPCLVLIDEWVAYARQLHDDRSLPGGDFETQFTFAQTLTESAKASRHCLLVVSLPASDHAQDALTESFGIEVGGVRGREALERLGNVVSRLESSWRPATAEESFEIVRRRLFEPLANATAFKQRDVIAHAFAALYGTQQAEFPPECRESDYEKRLQAAFPIHPEVFDRLYSDWSTLVTFQRTRGVLRLMAAVIHSLWEGNDRLPLILPASIPLDDVRVRAELVRYLPDTWEPIIERDIDGEQSLPLKIDREVSTLGRLNATRRVARTIFLGSAPTKDADHSGLEDRRVKLGCTLPGESSAPFGDALRRLAAQATYLHHDGTRYRYRVQPTVTKLADDRAEQFKRDADKIADAIEQRVRADLKRQGDFARVYPAPASSADVPDDTTARLVVLPASDPHLSGPDSAARDAADAILRSRGNAPRLYQNTLVFLAADKARLDDLVDAVARSLAWKSIVDEKDVLDLAPSQLDQAERSKLQADQRVVAQLPETWMWLLVPQQAKAAQSPITWTVLRLTGSASDGLAARAMRKLRADELVLAQWGPSMLRMVLDDVPLWVDSRHIELRQLADHLPRYLYLPRLASPEVLRDTVRTGVASLTWFSDGFATADSFDAASGRYRNLVVAQQRDIYLDGPGLLVRAEVADAQIKADEAARAQPPAGSDSSGDELGTSPSTGAGAGGNEGGRWPNGGSGETGAPPLPVTPDKRPRRFHGTVTLNPQRAGRDASRIAEEVLAHLVGLPDSQVTVTLEIHATIPGGAPEHVVRTVSENSHQLKFDAFGFERE